MKKYAIIQAQVLCTPYVKTTDAETAEDLVKDMGNIGETMPEGPLMVIDFDNRRVLRVSLDDDGNPLFTDNAGVAFGAKTDWEEFSKGTVVTLN
jgi:hypothetical protein